MLSANALVFEISKTSSVFRRSHTHLDSLCHYVEKAWSAFRKCDDFLCFDELLRRGVIFDLCSMCRAWLEEPSEDKLSAGACVYGHDTYGFSNSATDSFR